MVKHEDVPEQAECQQQHTCPRRVTMERPMENHGALRCLMEKKKSKDSQQRSICETKIKKLMCHGALSNTTVKRTSNSVTLAEGGHHWASHLSLAKASTAAVCDGSADQAARTCNTTRNHRSAKMQSKNAKEQKV